MNHALDQSSDLFVLAPFVILDDDALVCRQGEQTVTVRAPKSLLREICFAHDGTASMSRWLEEASCRWNADDLHRLVDRLVDARILVPVSMLAQEVWRHVKNPRKLGVPASPAMCLDYQYEGITRDRFDSLEGARIAEESSLLRSMTRRRSSRKFVPGDSNCHALTKLLWAAYGHVDAKEESDGKCRRTVPSPGALYPLDIHIALFFPLDGYARGIYSVRYGAERTVSLWPVSTDVALLHRCFKDPALLEHALGTVIISGNFERCARKYGLRALSYVPLEAGHAAQNLLLCAEEQGLGTVEIGGIEEDRLAELLSLRDGTTPLTTIIFGHVSDDDAGPSLAQVDFEWIDTSSWPLSEEAYVGRARLVESRHWATGRGHTPILAYQKAVMEAHERRACETPRGIEWGRLAEVAGAIRPEQFVRYLPDQYDLPNFPYRPFDVDAAHAWVKASDYRSGRPSYVMADLTFYASALQKMGAWSGYTAASNSGVASHATCEEAFDHALAELLERHAFMRFWLTNSGHNSIDPRTLPVSVQRRISCLSDFGAQIVVKDISCGEIPVVACIGRLRDSHVTRVSACANVDVEGAIEHALFELETLLYPCQDKGGYRELEADHVKSLRDHADLYAHPRHFDRASAHLFRDGRAIGMSEVGKTCPNEWDEVVDRVYRQYGGIEVVSLKANAPTLRLLVPGLLALSGGFQTEPCGSLPENERQRAFDWISTKSPHPFV